MIWHAILSVVIIKTAAQERKVQPSIRGLESRIIGGSPADFHEYPWFALGDGCGASLIAPEWVLTAAHCSPENFDDLRIGAVCRGSVDPNYTNCNTFYEMRYPKKQFVHPKWDDHFWSYDLRLIQLTVPSTVQPVQIDDGSVSPSYDGGQGGLWTAGFGLLDVDPKERATYLMELEKRYVTNTDCEKAYENENEKIDWSMLCAINGQGTKSACFGDSGGPLYDKINEKLVGVVSWGPSDCKGQPIIYGRVSTGYDWIQETICKESLFSKPSMCYENNPSSEPPNSPATYLPTSSPSIISSTNPSIDPTAVRSLQPTLHASTLPSTSLEPSIQPSISPSLSLHPSTFPVSNPSFSPSTKASSFLSGQPAISAHPSTRPTIQSTPPSVEGSSLPTIHFSSAPTLAISASPSTEPTNSLMTNNENDDAPNQQDKICSDDDDFIFDVQWGSGQTRKCSWFRFNASKTEMRVLNYCDTPSIAEACQKSCGSCTCADNPTYNFERNNGRNASCQWLQGNNKTKRQERYCGSGKESPSDIALACPESCGFC